MGKYDLELMFDNAGTASQHLPLVDDKVVRGALLRSLAYWLQDQERIAEAVAEIHAHPDFHS